MSTDATAQENVQFTLQSTVGGKKIGNIKLNVQKSLNVLDLDMARAMISTLCEWHSRDDIVCVFIEGSGERALCAGGDVRAIYRACVETPGSISSAAKEFFIEEYRLDYLIHCYEKPIVIWGAGIVMGGGLGIMMAGSHRIVTPSSRIAMPEVTIGLYPDVGGSYFLPRMPGKLGLFLGMSSYNMDAADACYLDLADYFLNDDGKQTLLDAMLDCSWEDKAKVNHQLLSQLIKKQIDQHQCVLGGSQLKAERKTLDGLMEGSVSDIVERVGSFNTQLPWLKSACQTLLSGSPISWHLIYQQFYSGDQTSLADCFRKELDWSVNCTSIGDFCEGVRALLIDKDKQPKWRFSSASQVPASLITTIMSSPWQQAHPLERLEELEPKNSN